MESDEWEEALRLRAGRFKYSTSCSFHLKYLWIFLLKYLYYKEALKQVLYVFILQVVFIDILEQFIKIEVS